MGPVRKIDVQRDTFGELYRLIGPELLLTLIEARGGTLIHIPLPRSMPRCFLAKLIGVDAALKVARAHGGDRLMVPIAKPWRIRKLRLSGATYATIAARLCVDEKTIARVLKETGDTAKRERRAGCSERAVSLAFADAEERARRVRRGASLRRPSGTGKPS